MKTNNRNFYLICLLAILFTFACGDAYAGDVFGAIKNKTWNVVSGVRRIAMLIAAFGLIGFAFGAIFGKISWKWFANIAIGLFLVANVGLFIDYFATKSGRKGQYASLGYGNYINDSTPNNGGGGGGNYAPTPGSDEAPSPQNPGGDGGNSGGNSSDQINGDNCQPGTGVGCEGSGKDTGNGSGGDTQNQGNPSEQGKTPPTDPSKSKKEPAKDNPTTTPSKKTGPVYVDPGLDGTEKMEGVGISKADTSIPSTAPSLNVGDIINNIDGIK